MYNYILFFHSHLTEINSSGGRVCTLYLNKALVVLNVLELADGWSVIQFDINCFFEISSTELRTKCIVSYYIRKKKSHLKFFDERFVCLADNLFLP